MIEIRGMVALQQNDGPVYVQPHAVTFVKPVKNGCKVGVAFCNEPLFVTDGIDMVKRKLEGEHEPE